MSSIEQIQADIVAEFEQIADWKDRYKHIIELGRGLPALPEEHRVEENLVKGCQNRVWLHARLDEGGQVIFEADSEAQIVKGLVALLLRVYSGHEPDAILAAAPTFIQELRLGENLTMNRANGLASMIKQMKMYAMGFKVILSRQAR